MDFENFKAVYRKQISNVLSCCKSKYDFDYERVASLLYVVVLKYLNATSEREVNRFLSELNVGELILARACAQGSERAWEDFLRDYRGFLQSIAKQVAGVDLNEEDLLEAVLAELYGVGQEGIRRSKFENYSGRGSFKGWLRAVVYQVSVNMRRASRRFVQPAEEIKPTLDTSERPAASNEKLSACAECLSRALIEVLTKRNAQERLLLSYYYYDGLTLKQIGLLFNVHEATVSRWLQKLQKCMRKEVMKVLIGTGMKVDQIEECFELAAEGVLDVKVELRKD
ncbi:MAG: sigma-70 family RNA polymerase sigma factor [Acidobacteriota bacterium]|nr:sigma-70 family RNA polymerase sigma factor [Blastocatellia bacterium]MDW8413825.1 sigma-70 family RNA polymerase sigma factor [Acidobacteriota bacterium]